jgi:hypothetical protein
MQAYSLVLNIISGCWLVFVAIWVLAAVSTKRTVYRESRRNGCATGYCW